MQSFKLKGLVPKNENYPIIYLPSSHLCIWLLSAKDNQIYI